MAIVAVSFLIGSSSFLQIMRITIKSRLSSKFGPCVRLSVCSRVQT